MDLKAEYNRLLETNKLLQEEIVSLKNNIKMNGTGTNMLSDMFKSSLHPFAIVNTKTYCFEGANNTFLTILGYKREEIIGRPSEELFIYPETDHYRDFIKMISEQKSFENHPAKLRTKAGNEKDFLLSAETIFFDERAFLMINFMERKDSDQLEDNQTQRNAVAEIFETISQYMALFGYDNDQRIYIIDINNKAEEVEFVRKEEVIGRFIDETPIYQRIKLIELLQHIRITGEAYKLAASTKGDDSEGYYMGFPLSSGNIVITWEPGNLQKNMDDLNKQSLLFERFAEMLPQIIYEVNSEGIVKYANKYALDFFGYSKEDLSNKILISEVFPDDYKKMVENLKLLETSREVQSHEYSAQKKNGKRVPVVTHSFATFLGNKAVSFRGVLTDVSSQKEYENRINREKAFLEHVINSAPAAIVITNPSGTISMINREFTDLFGFTPEEAVNENINDLIVPDDLLEEAEVIDGLAEQGTKETRETIRKRKNGQIIHVSLVASAIDINSETIAHLGIYRDITIERKNHLLQDVLFNISTSALKQFDIEQIYAVIVKELNKLWDTNNFFIALHDKATDTISLPFFSDEKDNFYEIPTSKTITGWVIRQNKSVLLREDDLNLLEKAGEIDLVGTPCKVWMGVPLRFDNDIIGVMCLQDYNDEKKFLNEDLYVMEFVGNQVAMILQRKMMLDNLVNARKKAEDAALSKQQFMSTMSHEIRTPLNEVIGITNLLLQGNPREDQMDFINTLKFSGNHLLTLVNDVLDFNKMESGKIIFEQVGFSLSLFLNEIKRSYSFRAHSKKLDFDIVKENNLPEEVTGDPLRLNQILSNLLSNAIKFTNNGTIKVIVRELSKSAGQSTMEFAVCDTGIGIPKEMHEHVFDSFAQATPETTRQFGGTGLGLAICKKLVELQGGSIDLESEPGKGSIFRFSLSFGIPEKGVPQKTEVAESYIGLEGKKILVAEDNKVNFFVANKFLTNWGIKVSHAENGRLALDMIEIEDFDLILMDLHMPILDGIEATKIIRKSPVEKIRNIPIVALTAAIMSESQDKIEDLKINDYVLKPFKPHDLFERIKRNIR
ncbi:MAG TPA: PAS domain S-box protein [Bacteroidales bacterium]|nr:PAS domain S-box protein [Bacteroidales bacterium]